MTAGECASRTTRKQPRETQSHRHNSTKGVCDGAVVLAPATFSNSVTECVMRYGRFTLASRPLATRLRNSIQEYSIQA